MHSMRGGQPPRAPSPARSTHSMRSHTPIQILIDAASDLAGLMHTSPHQVNFKGDMFPSAFHLLQALRFSNPDLRELIRHTRSVDEVRDIVNQNHGLIRPDWENIVLDVMDDVLVQKFRQHPDLMHLLLNTQLAELIFNDRDDFWGVGIDGRGANELDYEVYDLLPSGILSLCSRILDEFSLALSQPSAIPINHCRTSAFVQPETAVSIRRPSAFTHYYLTHSPIASGAVDTDTDTAFKVNVPHLTAAATRTLKASLVTVPGGGCLQAAQDQAMQYNTYSSPSAGSDIDSLFDEPEAFPETIFGDGSLASSLSSSYIEPPPPVNEKPATRTAPPIQGLYFDPNIILPDELAEDLLQKCMNTYFHHEDVNQVMLFERVVPQQVPPSAALSMLSEDSTQSVISPASQFPSFLTDLLHTLSKCMNGVLPSDTHELLFPPAGSPPKARQAIINLYRPGEGITPHVDLLDRFGDGIIGVSLGSGCVMQFAKANSKQGLEVGHGSDDESESAAVFLPHGSVYVMSGKARYDWTHGIAGRKEDWVQTCADSGRGRWVMRSIRVSITFRWLLPGADIVGGLPDATAKY
ncbi:hypothetical protein NM688_g5085 [Phlebia brevispora]|uniref:Uncharacterized protein n=1 Tax=Phlebia brevispora TaxID=194682 RepID=A0ACC1T143_9APHY|nr:hypothetical protein NM688_g5085 [Phlebia brevispora]